LITALSLASEEEAANDARATNAAAGDQQLLLLEVQPAVQDLSALEGLHGDGGGEGAVTPERVLLVPDPGSGGEGLSDATGAPPAPPGPPDAAPIEGWATHYGEAYNGQRMGCQGAGLYSSDDPTIVAVSPERYAEWPCGQQLHVSGPAGSIVVTRQDSCPGCGANVLDLSEEGNRRVCGIPEHTCRVIIEVMR